MYHSVAMNVIQGVADRNRDTPGPFNRQLSSLAQNLAEQAALYPLHHHVDAAAVFIREHFHHAGVIEFFADFRLALEALEEYRVRFHLRMRNFDCDLTAGAHIRGTKNGGHPAAGNDRLNTVVVELVAGMYWCHERRESKKAGRAELAELIKSPTIHTHTFHAPNADKL